MNYNIRFKGFDSSEKVRTYFEERATKLEKFVPPTTTVNVTLEDDNIRKNVEVNLTHRGDDFVAKQSSDNLLTSIDDAVDKLVRQLSKAKSKKINRKPNPEKEEIF